MSLLTVLRAGGLLTVQDMGRPGHLAAGLSRGGAMDRLALLEAAALLGAPTPLAALEMAGAGGAFEVSAPTRIALTGAPMTATLDQRPLRWNATHLVAPGQRLRIGGVQRGVYGYLTPAGGLATTPWLGSRAAHLAIGVGTALKGGETLQIGTDPKPERPARGLPEETSRFAGGAIRILDGPQTNLFDQEVITRFYATTLWRGQRANRQGVQLETDEDFVAGAARHLASDLIGPGEIQITGDGIPYVLMAECQTVGGYPRIGTVLPADLPIVAQSAPGTVLRPVRVPLELALATYKPEDAVLRDLSRLSLPLLRDPATVRNLLSYQLVSGATAGDDLDR